MRRHGVVVTAVTVSMVLASVMLGVVPAGATPQVVVPDVAKVHKVLPVTAATNASGGPSARLTPAAAVAHVARGTVSPVRSFLPAGMALCPSVNGSKVSSTASCGISAHLATSELPLAGGGNDVTAPIASGNDTSVANGNGDGNSVGTSVSDLVDVDGMVDGILDSVDLNTILQGR